MNSNPVTGPVDVLAVIDAQLGYLANYSRIPYLSEADSLHDARAAVAELIVCARGALAALHQPHTHPADVAAARVWLARGIAAVSP